MAPLLLLVLGALGVGYVMTRKRTTEPSDEPPPDTPAPRGFTYSGGPKLLREATGGDPSVASGGEESVGAPFAMDPFAVLKFAAAGDIAGQLPQVWGADGSVACEYPGIRTVPGDIAINVLDTDPEVGSTWTATDAADCYSVVSTQRAIEAESRAMITQVNLDKRAGGSDKLWWYREDDGTYGERRRDRGEQWPKWMKGRVLYVNGQDFVSTHPYHQLMRIGEVVDPDGLARPYLYCRARSDRTPGRKQIELVRVAKMHKAFKDVGEVYALPLFDFAAETFGIFLGAMGASGIATSLFETTRSTINNAVRHGLAGGDFNSWRDGFRLLRDSISLEQMGALAMQVGFRLPTKVRQMAETAANVPGATEWTRLAATTFAAEHVAPIIRTQEQWGNGHSPSTLLSVVYYT